MKKILKKVVLVAIALFCLGAVFLLVTAWTPMGSAPSEEHFTRMKASPQWSDTEEIFVNPQPMYNDYVGSLSFFADLSPYADPEAPLPVLKVDREQAAQEPMSGLRITWLGHSTTLIDIDGHRFLTDPIFGPTASPWTFLGPARWYEPPLALEDLPPLDAVLISHDHYDHLDYVTISKLKSKKDLKFIVPLGVGAHLMGWGIEASRIIELDWWSSYPFGEVTVTATPARHASGRQVFDQNRTLWAGYAFNGPKHDVYFSGDTGLAPSFNEVGDKLGPFDVTMVEVGAYNSAWPDWHSGPEQAVLIHRMLRGKRFIPIHWGLFNLAAHGWTEPVERTLLEAEKSGVDVLVPRPGEALEPDLAPKTTRWWPKVPFKTAEEDPIIATGVEIKIP